MVHEGAMHKKNKPADPEATQSLPKDEFATRRGSDLDGTSVLRRLTVQEVEQRLLLHIDDEAPMAVWRR